MLRDIKQKISLASFHHSEEDGKKYGIVEYKFENHCIKWLNKICIWSWTSIIQNSISGTPAHIFIILLCCLIEPKGKRGGIKHQFISSKKV